MNLTRSRRLKYNVAYERTVKAEICAKMNTDVKHAHKLMMDSNIIRSKTKQYIEHWGIKNRFL